MKFYDWLAKQHPEAFSEEARSNNKIAFSSKKPYYKNSRIRRLDLRKKREEIKTREEE